MTESLLSNIIRTLRFARVHQKITEVSILKKVLAMITVVAVLSLAGSALAYGGGMYHGQHGNRGNGHHHHNQQGFNCDLCGQAGQSWQSGQKYAPGSQNGGNGPVANMPCRMMPGGRSNGRWAADVPQEMRDKMVEAEKLKIDLRAEMSKLQVDKAKAMEIWKKHRALKNEIAEWSFAQRLEQMPVPQIQPVQPPQPTQQ